MNTLTGLPLSVEVAQEVAHKWYTLRKEDRVLIRSNWDGADVLARADTCRGRLSRCQRRFRTPTLTEKDLQDTDMYVMHARDAKKGLSCLVEPDHFPTKLFESETASSDASQKQCSRSLDAPELLHVPGFVV